MLCLGCNKEPESPSANHSTSGVKLYGTRYGNILKSFATTPDGGYMFGGYTNTSVTEGEQGFIQKSDKNGNRIWYQEYGGVGVDLFNVVHPLTEGGFIAAGATMGSDGYKWDGFLVKTDLNGSIMWQKKFRNENGLQFYDVKETSDYGLVVVGFSSSNDPNPMYILKTDQYGDSLWEQQIVQLQRNSIGASVTTSPNGEIAIAGLQQRYDSISRNYPTFTYISPTGDLLFQRIYINFGSLPWANNGNLWGNGRSWDYGYLNFEKIISRPDGFLFLMSSEPQALPDNAACLTCGNALSATLFKIDFKGNIIWRHTFTGLGNGVTFNDAVDNTSGGLLISGGAFDASGVNYCWLLNTDANGNRTSENFTPINGTSSWAAGAFNTGKSYAIGVTSLPLLINRVGFFSFLTTDLNGKIIDQNKQ